MLSLVVVIVTWAIKVIVSSGVHQESNLCYHLHQFVAWFVFGKFPVCSSYNLGQKYCHRWWHYWKIWKLTLLLSLWFCNLSFLRQCRSGDGPIGAFQYRCVSLQFFVSPLLLLGSRQAWNGTLSLCQRDLSDNRANWGTTKVSTSLTSSQQRLIRAVSSKSGEKSFLCQ